MFRFKGALAFVLATVSILSRKADASNLGIAFSGGGFKSVADQTALTAGLLAALMKREEALLDDSISSPLATSNLYKEVKSLSTISGGSWFTSYLAYSENYRRMVEDMAKQAATGADKGIISGTFYERYGKRFDALKKKSLDGTSATNDIQRAFIAMDALISPALSAIPFLGYFVGLFKSGLKTAVFFSRIGSDGGGAQSNWFSATKTILGDDINQMTLGSEVQEWSMGKNWNIITSAATPSSPEIPFLPASPELFSSTIWASGLDNLRYSAKGENINGLVPCVPILFSVVLGNAGSPPAPLPESAYPVSEKLSLTYVGGTGRGWSFPFPFFNFGESFGPKTIEGGIQPRRNDKNSFSNMPIVGPVAASSAAIGFTSLVPNLTPLFTQFLQLNPSVGFACKGDGADPSVSFTTGQDLIDKVWNAKTLNNIDFDSMTENGVCNFLDGGVTDPFGIATALASGADEIFCVNAIPDILSVDDAHFEGGLFTTAATLIFEKGSSVKENFSDEGGRTVKKMKLETFKVKTVENIYFGIEGGREVTLHVFSTESTLSTGDIIAGAVGFREIGDYIEDIMNAFTLNSRNMAIVNKMLMALGALKGSAVVTNE